MTIDTEAFTIAVQEISLDQFIATCPKEVRVGQHFVNEYYKSTDETSQKLYQLDGKEAKEFIRKLMNDWQWIRLPKK
jgi:hypothetical protein